MYRDLILKSGNSQRFTSKLFDNSPKTKAIMLLGLHLDRILQDPDTPFLFQVWPLPHHFIFEVCSEPVADHTLFNILSAPKGLSRCQTAASNSRAERPHIVKPAKSLQQVKAVAGLRLIGAAAEPNMDHSKLEFK